jgi:hypothetical protein
VAGRPYDVPMSDGVHLRIDLGAEDETGLPWTYLPPGSVPPGVVPGRHVIAGAGDAVAVVQVVDVAEDGLVHVKPVRGTVESNRHLLDAPSTGP